MLKNKLFSILIIITIVLSLTACSNYTSKSETTSEATQCVEAIQSSETASGNNTESPDIEVTIYINGELLESKTDTMFSNGFIKIPFVSVFEALGANVNWESNTKAIISYNDESYVLDTDALTLSKSDKLNANYLFGVCGGTYILYAEGKEIILDSRTLKDLFERLQIETSIKYDRDNGIVYIDTK